VANAAIRAFFYLLTAIIKYFRYKMPRMIEFVESLPKSTSGKISRELIRRMDLKKLNSI